MTQVGVNHTHACKKNYHFTLKLYDGMRKRLERPYYMRTKAISK